MISPHERRPGRIHLAEERQKRTARLHAIRLRRLGGEEVGPHVYDGASGSLRALGVEGELLHQMVVAATFEWPSERGYQASENFAPLAQRRTP